MLKNLLICAVVTAAAALIPVLGGLYAVPASNTDTGVELPILMYHSVLKNSELSGKYIVTPKTLEEDIEYLEKNGYTTVSMQSVIDYVDNDAPLPEKPVMLTFDDGSYNNYEYVLPILEKHNAHGIFCVVGKYTDDYTSMNEANTAYGYMRWIEVYNMSVNEHTELANHSYNFHKYGGGRNGSKKRPGEGSADYKELFRADTEKVQNGFKANSVTPPVIYAYPFGAYSKESLDVLKSMGFRATLTCNEGVNIITHNPECLYLLKRNNRPSGVSSEQFLSKLINKE